MASPRQHHESCVHQYELEYNMQNKHLYPALHHAGTKKAWDFKMEILQTIAANQCKYDWKKLPLMLQVPFYSRTRRLLRLWEEYKAKYDAIYE